MKGWPSLVDGAALLTRSGSHRREFESLTLRQAVVAQPGKSTDLISRGPLVQIQPSARSENASQATASSHQLAEERPGSAGQGGS